MDNAIRGKPFHRRDMPGRNHFSQIIGRYAYIAIIRIGQHFHACFQVQRELPAKHGLFQQRNP